MDSPNTSSQFSPADSRILRLLAVIALMASVLCPTTGLAEDKPKVAVMPIKQSSEKLDEKTVESATKYLRSGIAASNAFIVIAEKRQTAKLEKMIDQKKKKSYKSCYDKSCQIPLGRQLAADSILRSEVSYFGSCVLSVELVDLAKEATVVGAQQKFECGMKGFQTAIDGAVESLSKNYRDKTKAGKSATDSTASDTSRANSSSPEPTPRNVSPKGARTASTDQSRTSAPETRTKSPSDSDKAKASSSTSPAPEPGSSARTKATANKSPKTPADLRSFSVGFSPFGTIYPLDQDNLTYYEIALGYGFTNTFEMSLIFGGANGPVPLEFSSGDLTYTEQVETNVGQLGLSSRWYLTGNFENGFHIGGELMVRSITVEHDNIKAKQVEKKTEDFLESGGGAGGFIGYKYVTSWGLTFDTQLGLKAAEFGNPLLVNANLGWSF